jgi:hypothetical protein
MRRLCDSSMCHFMQQSTHEPKLYLSVVLYILHLNRHVQSMSSKEFTSLLQADGYDSRSNVSKAEYVSKGIQDAIGLPLQHNDDDSSNANTGNSNTWATWQLSAIRQGFQQHLSSTYIQRKMQLANIKYTNAKCLFEVFEYAQHFAHTPVACSRRPLE